MNTPPVDITAPPKYKVILLASSTNELEDLLTKGWKIANVIAHPKGAVIIMIK